jgi:hypothetical protein
MAGRGRVTEDRVRRWINQYNPRARKSVYRPFLQVRDVPSLGSIIDDEGAENQ